MCRKFSTFSCEGWSQKIHQAHEYAYTHSEKVTGNRFNMQKGNTHTHTYNHTCGPGLSPPHLFVWWLLKPPWWELIWSARRRKTERENKQRRINGNSLLLTCSLSPIVALRGAQSAQTHSITHACTNTHPFTHTHLSKETIEDGEWIGCCQNGCLLFTNLIILFSSRWARWVITPPVYKSHGWCKIHSLVGWIIALGEYTPLYDEAIAHNRK